VALRRTRAKKEQAFTFTIFPTGSSDLSYSYLLPAEPGVRTAGVLRETETPGNSGQNWEIVHDSKISGVTLEVKRQIRNSSGIPGNNVHDSKIPWATRETNGKTWKPSGRAGKIVHDFKISPVTRETNGQAWNSSGKLAKFLEIDRN
jgi:hypothetical protein